MITTVPRTDAFASLRPFLRQKAVPTSRCELCGTGIGEHAHLFELNSRKVVCSCEPCAILFSNQAAGHYRRIPSDVQLLQDFVLPDEQWESLAIPINMAFFCASSDSHSPALYYPSPAGATESLLSIDAWEEIVANNPILGGMQPQVQCLLVNRMTEPHKYFLTPIDECYRLVGLIRSKWRGFSGGSEVWKDIATFFVTLEKRSAVTRKVPHARSEFSD